MKFSALALDYDGTIAIDGVFDPTVREAVAEARQRGIVVILVTGRQLPDLGRVAGKGADRYASDSLRRAHRLRQNRGLEEIYRRSKWTP